VGHDADNIWNINTVVRLRNLQRKLSSTLSLQNLAAGLVYFCFVEGPTFFFSYRRWKMSHKSRTVEPYITIQMCRHSTTFRYLARKPTPLWTWFIHSFPTSHTNIHLSFYLCSLVYWIIWCGRIFQKLVFDVRFTIESTEFALRDSSCGSHV
jgi:hypothetical protein